MEFFGNTSDPLAKTLKDLNAQSMSSGMGDAGDFFKPVHDRDKHVKPANNKDQPIEFNSAILSLDNSEVMLKYIKLKNKIVSGLCLAMEETTHVDKDTSATTVFIKWLQPEGLFELGTANPILTGAALKTLEEKISADREADSIIDDTVDSPKTKGKGTRKKNTKVQL